jgi:hypothetical protein
LHGVNEQLEFWKLKVAGRDIIPAILSMPEFNVKPILAQGFNIVVDAFTVCWYVINSKRTLRVPPMRFPSTLG